MGPPVRLLLLAALTCFTAVHGATDNEKELWTSMGNFGHSLLQHVSAKAGASENVLLSPLSVHSALSMALVGACGATRTQMLQVLGLPANETNSSKKLHDAFSELTSRKHDAPSSAPSSDNQREPIFEGGVDFSMRLANRMYLKKEYPIEKSYADEVQKAFHADVVNVDFGSEGVQVQEKINSFVNETTKGLIPKILDQPLDSKTVTALINALYFKGDWRHQMGELNEPLLFNKGCGGQLEKEHPAWLTVTKDITYLNSEKLDAVMIRLPYRSKTANADMLIVVPNESHNCKLQDWTKSLKWSDVQQELSKMTGNYIKLTMPKFEMGSRFQLEEVLPEMGMRLAFQPGEANFSGIVSEPEKLNIDKVIHQTKMIVTKHGTEAAAATVVSILRPPKPAPPRIPFEVRVDRSFYVAILYGDANGGRQQAASVLPLFLGLVHSV